MVLTLPPSQRVWHRTKLQPRQGYQYMSFVLCLFSRWVWIWVNGPIFRGLMSRADWSWRLLFGLRVVTVNSTSPSRCISDLYKLHATLWHLSAGSREDDKGDLTTDTYKHPHSPLMHRKKHTAWKKSGSQALSTGFFFCIPTHKKSKSREQRNPCSLKLSSLNFVHSHTRIHITHICTHLQYKHRLLRLPCNITSRSTSISWKCVMTMWWATSTHWGQLLSCPVSYFP